MNRNDVNRAITHLRTLNRRSAGQAAQEIAAEILPAAAKYKTPGDLAALGALSVALYHAAATRETEDGGIGAVCAAVEYRYRALMQGTAIEDVFRATVEYPEELENYLRVLTQLPRTLVIEGMETVRASLASL